MLTDMSKYFEIYPGTPYGRRCSVHYEKTDRLEKAREQAALKPVAVKNIISHVNDFLKSIGMEIVESPIVEQPHKIDYEKLQYEYGTEKEEDLVWMKFTKDGHLGVVASSNDVNFDIPPAASQYDEKEWSYKFNRLIWKYNTAGILIHQLGKEWDTSFALVFPMVNIPHNKTCGYIERAIGNYLISRGVPILDFYSHNYQREDFIKITSDTESKNAVDIDEAFFDLYPNASDNELDDEMEYWDGVDP